jgi:hypothetical protein
LFCVTNEKFNFTLEFLNKFLIQTYGAAVLTERADLITVYRVKRAGTQCLTMPTLATPYNGGYAPLIGVF